jgi:hypothetical protein
MSYLFLLNLHLKTPSWNKDAGAMTLVPGNGNKVFYIFLAVTFPTKFCQQWTEATGSHLQVP